MPTQKPPCATHRSDFTEVTAKSPRRVIDETRAVCASCPVLLSCLKYLETIEVAGMAGGMLESQRVLWRHRNGLETDDTTWVDAFEAEELPEGLLHEFPTGPQRSLSPMLVRIVERMTNAGFTAQEIAERTGLTKPSINYVRRTKFAGGLTGIRKEIRARAEDFVSHEVMAERLRGQGIKVELDEVGKINQKFVTMYHRAHGTGRTDLRPDSECR